MSRPIRATVSASALRHNYGVARRAAPSSRVMAVVKANAYGHGLERVGRALNYVEGFGLIEIEGAVRLRESGFEGEILLLEGFFEPAELPVLAAARIATAVHNDEQLRMLRAKPPKPPLDVYLKINTGMNRLGFLPGQLRGALDRLQESGAARAITLMTHFAMADAADGIEEAMKRFDEATRGFTYPRSVANTAAIFAHPRSHHDSVRLGIGLYGATPFAARTAASLGLKPAMTLASQLIAVRDLAPGDRVGYGSTFTADRAMRLGVVACGYADGYPRHAPSGTPVLVDGVRTCTVGRVSMDMITVDLTAVAGARVGTPVVLWGEGLPIDDVAQPAGTVGYELMCALAPRVPVTEVA